MKIERFEDIEAWKEARKPVNRVYGVCSVNDFRKDYSLTDQIRRAAISVMANITEGFARKGNKEFIQFLFISKSSYHLSHFVRIFSYPPASLDKVGQKMDGVFTHAQKGIGVHSC